MQTLSPTKLGERVATYVKDVGESLDASCGKSDAETHDIVLAQKLRLEGDFEGLLRSLSNDSVACLSAILLVTRMVIETLGTRTVREATRRKLL